MKGIKKPVAVHRGPTPSDAGQVRPEALRFARVLVPTDFSDYSKKALRYAARFVELFGSRITLIHVLEPVMSPDFTHFPLALDEEKMVENSRQRLHALGRSLIDERSLDEAVIRTGNPFHEISETARELKVDLVVISTHGYTGLRRAMMGSTTERVVRHAPCPVLVVR